MKRASASRPSGEWNDDDFDVLADGVVVGRIFHAAAAARRRTATRPRARTRWRRSRKVGEGTARMLEAITLIGAIVGLATGVFTFWDRLARGRPLAWLTVTIRTGGTPADPGIRIKNPGPTDLFIQGVRPHPADIYSVAKDHSIKATIRSNTKSQ
jgi:hypothetical protein